MRITNVDYDYPRARLDGVCEHEEPFFFTFDRKDDTDDPFERFIMIDYFHAMLNVYECDHDPERAMT